MMQAVAATKSLPPGVVNIFTESGNEGAPFMVGSPHVDIINYTGSTKVGRSIAVQAAGTLKTVTLELGGKTPLVGCHSPSARSSHFCASTHTTVRRAMSPSARSSKEMLRCEIVAVLRGSGGRSCLCNSTAGRGITFAFYHPSHGSPAGQSETGIYGDRIYGDRIRIALFQRARNVRGLRSGRASRMRRDSFLQALYARRSAFEACCQLRQSAMRSGEAGGHAFGISGNDGEVSARRLIRLGATLFPISQRSDRNMIARGKFFLGQFQRAAQSPDARYSLSVFKLFRRHRTRVGVGQRGGGDLFVAHGAQTFPVRLFDE
jgi:hypothetical protein